MGNRLIVRDSRSSIRLRLYTEGIARYGTYHMPVGTRPAAWKKLRYYASSSAAGFILV
ncbi:hypothetical protein HMPREF9141_2733 [Prevotella multiformis DSM 16608]|uniref:Uncharacterized protein n=1 Tax=Prevotella multiformis DSM 16608 TaxID=888743 RepID=F0FAW6_9BACT|nr:hypothetical protein HMPREF9141_2733 [Prevotella multiformis DSM 16608]